MFALVVAFVLRPNPNHLTDALTVDCTRTRKMDPDEMEYVEVRFEIPSGNWLFVTHAPLRQISAGPLHD
jgi:hypothetical protein